MNSTYGKRQESSLNEKGNEKKINRERLPLCLRLCDLLKSGERDINTDIAVTLSWQVHCLNFSRYFIFAFLIFSISWAEAIFDV